MPTPTGLDFHQAITWQQITSLARQLSENIPLAEAYAHRELAFIQTDDSRMRREVTSAGDRVPVPLAQLTNPEGTWFGYAEDQVSSLRWRAARGRAEIKISRPPGGTNWTIQAMAKTPAHPYWQRLCWTFPEIDPASALHQRLKRFKLKQRGTIRETLLDILQDHDVLPAGLLSERAYLLFANFPVPLLRRALRSG